MEMKRTNGQHDLSTLAAVVRARDERLERRGRAGVEGDTRRRVRSCERWT